MPLHLAVDFVSMKRSPYKNVAIDISAQHMGRLIVEGRRRREECLRRYSLDAIFSTNE